MPDFIALLLCCGYLVSLLENRDKKISVDGGGKLGFCLGRRVADRPASPGLIAGLKPRGFAMPAVIENIPSGLPANTTLTVGLMTDSAKVQQLISAGFFGPSAISDPQHLAAQSALSAHYREVLDAPEPPFDYAALHRMRYGADY